MEELRRGTISLIKRRIVLFVLLICFFQTADRQNVAYAALQMNKDLHMTPQEFGFGVSMFFIGYTVMQIPNGLAFKVFGPRKVLTVILLLWGVVASAMALSNNGTTFAWLRAVMGAVEAGVPGGIIYLFGNWMSREARSRAAATNTFAIMGTALVLGAVSGWLIDHPPAGIAGWRWMFLVEGAPAAILGVVTWFYLPDGPKDAKFLSPEQKGWLIAELEAEATVIRQKSSSTFSQLFSDACIWLLCAVWFTLLLGVTALQLWMPLAIKQFSGDQLSATVITLIAAIPWIGALAGAWWNTYHSDKTQERYWHVGLAMTLTTSGLLAAMATSNPIVAMSGLTLAATGLGASHGVFFTLPMSLVTGTAAAGGYALINLVGNLSGFLASFFVGWVRQTTGHFEPAFICIALGSFFGALLLFAVRSLANKRMAAAAPMARLGAA
jgi:sugar phosphate permease